MAVYMREVLARPWVGVRVQPMIVPLDLEKKNAFMRKKKKKKERPFAITGSYFFLALLLKIRKGTVL